MAKLGILASITTLVAALGFATVSAAGGVTPCVTKEFKTIMAEEACAKGGQPAAKDAMKKFMKDAKIKTCNAFLKSEILASPARCYLALGSIAHDAALMALGEKRSAFKFGHNRRHDLSNGRILIDSYHCSRYNTNTGVLTPPMFREAVAHVKEVAGL